MKTARLNRLFNPKSNRCFDVAIDHGFFNEFGFLSGIEDIGKAIATLVDAGPDAIQLTVGQAPLLQAYPGRHKPSLVLRTDVANVYGQELPRSLFSRMIKTPVEQALRLDATCVVVNLFRIPNQPEVTDQCIQNILEIKPECDRHGMPLMIEPLVFQANEKAGGYMVDGDLKKILPLVRQAVELGADIIKADPTDDVSLYHKVVEIAGRIPVLVRGGGKAPDEEILHRTEAPDSARHCGHCVWTQCNSAPKSSGYDQSAYGHRPRRRNRHSGGTISKIDKSHEHQGKNWNRWRRVNGTRGSQRT